MKISKLISYSSFLANALFASTPVVIEDQELINYVNQNLPHQGTLKITPKGFLYLELPKEYVYNLLPFLQQYNVCAPPYFTEDKVGAHISVAIEEEMQGLDFSEIPGLGETISFQILDLSEVDLENSIIGSEMYMLRVDAPRLSQIREQIGLSPKVKGYDFHITIAVNCPS